MHISGAPPAGGETLVVTDRAAPTLRRLRDNSELLALAEPAEPDAIRIVGDARDRGIGRDVRAWVVEEGSVPLGVVVIARLAADHWYASPLVFDDLAAPLLGSVVERSRARALAGPTEHVAPLVPFVPRGRPPGRLPFIVDLEELSPDTLTADPRVRHADRRDLDALVEVYSEFELMRIATRPRLRSYLERSLRDRVVIIIDVDGSIAAASILEFRALTFDMWSSTTVLPAHRGQGLYFPIYDTERKMTRDSGRRNCFVLSRLNKVPLDRQLQALGDTAVVREWMSVSLPPRRVAGEKRVRSLIERLEGRVKPRRPLDS